MIYQWDQRTDTITDYIFLGKTLVTEAQVSLGNGAQSVDNTNVGYTGHQWDNDSGLNYMQARYYDPILARFMSNDPIGFRDIHSFNRYAYANNNPYKFTDPFGMASKKVGSGSKYGQGTGNMADADNLPGEALGSLFMNTTLDDWTLKRVKPGKGKNGAPKYNDSEYKKHGNEAKEGSKGVISRKPTDGQAALDNSLPVKASATSRIGVDTINKEVVVLKSNGKGTNEYHGFVPAKLNQDEANTVRKRFSDTVKVKNNGSCTVKCK